MKLASLLPEDCSLSFLINNLGFDIDEIKSYVKNHEHIVSLMFAIKNEVTSGFFDGEIGIDLFNNAVKNTSDLLSLLKVFIEQHLAKPEIQLLIKEKQNASQDNNIFQHIRISTPSENIADKLLNTKLCIDFVKECMREKEHYLDFIPILKTINPTNARFYVLHMQLNQNAVINTLKILSQSHRSYEEMNLFIECLPATIAKSIVDSFISKYKFLREEGFSLFVFFKSNWVVKSELEKMKEKEALKMIINHASMSDNNRTEEAWKLMGNSSYKRLGTEDIIKLIGGKSHDEYQASIKAALPKADLTKIHAASSPIPTPARHEAPLSAYNEYRIYYRFP
jgi:hypothetical protein